MSFPQVDEIQTPQLMDAAGEVLVYDELSMYHMKGNEAYENNDLQANGWTM